MPIAAPIAVAPGRTYHFDRGLRLHRRAEVRRPGLQHDLDAVVLLVPERLVCASSVLEREAVRDDERRVDLTPLHPLEQWPHVLVDVRLAHLERQALVER